MISKLTPRQLFAIDCLGAFLSALLLTQVLTRHEAVFGIPVPTLYLLGSIPLFFALYDLICRGLRSKHNALLLRIIALANLGYCVLSLTMVLIHQQTLTIWGWAYLLGEITIIMFLAVIEWKVAKRLNQ